MFRSLLCAAGMLLMIAGPMRAATFDGQTVTIFQYFEDNEPHEREWGRRDIVAGEGIHLEFYTLDLVQNFLRLTLDEDWYFLQNRGRNGLVLQDTYDLLPDFLALTLLNSEFDNDPVVRVSEDELIFDFSQSGPNRSASATWGVTTVPLPATLPMLIAGLGLAGVVLRRRSIR